MPRGSLIKLKVGSVRLFWKMSTSARKKTYWETKGRIANRLGSVSHRVGATKGMGSKSRRRYSRRRGGYGSKQSA